MLLRKSENVRLGNREFDQKRDALAASDLALTKMVGARDDWTADAIVNRQNELADLALQVWPRRP